VTRTLAAGIALTIIASGIARTVWGPEALVPAVAFGLVSTGIQLMANWCNRRWAPGPKTVFLFAAAVLAWGSVFAPLPTALGFLGVIVPLLFLELGMTR
jgi:hypothetical protein